MVLYNWKKIVKKTGGKTKHIFAIMRWLTFNTVPTDNKDILYGYFNENFHGDSFLTNAEPLFHDRFNYSTSEIMQYFSLASYRSFAQYVHERTITLDLLHSRVEEDAIDNNRLLTLADGLIHFKYEDARRKIWL